VRVGLLGALDPGGIERGGVGREVEEGEGERHGVARAAGRPGRGARGEAVLGFRWRVS